MTVTPMRRQLDVRWDAGGRRSYRPSLLLDHPALRGCTGDAIAERIGVTRRTVVRWKAGTAWVTHRHADLAAVRLGCHPSTIWESWR